MSNETNSNSGVQSGMDGKTIGIISYLTLIGWIIAFVMHGNNKTKLGAFHIRQSLGLFIISFTAYIVMFFFLFIPILGWIISILIWIALIGVFVLWVIGLVAAINGEEKPVPLIGTKIQEMLAGIK